MRIELLAGLLALVVLIAGCTNAVNSANPADDKAMMEKKAMMSKEASEMAEEGFELMHGRMMMVDAKTNATAAMDKEMMLNDGTKVMVDGTVMRANGTQFMLHEGESIWMDGIFMKAGEMMKGGMESTQDSSMMMNDEYKGAILAGTTTPYLDFTKEDYDKALAGHKVILLNFYASWCPTCKAEQPEAFAAFNAMKYSNVVGFRVHFKDDQVTADETALAQQFGVPYQHTKVIIKNGDRVLKAPDSWDKERYLTEIGKYA